MITAGLLAYDADDVKPGWIALVLVIVLAIATFLLWLSMNKQLRKIDLPGRAESDESGTAKDAPAADAPAEADNRDDDRPPPA